MAYSQAGCVGQISPKYVHRSAASPQNNFPTRNQTKTSALSFCANHAPVAAVPCASSRSSAAGKNRCRAPRHGSRPHDGTHVSHATLNLAAPGGPGPSDMCFVIVETEIRSNQTQSPGIPSSADDKNCGNRRHKGQRPNARGTRRSNPQHTFSIDITKPTRLPPWEIFQRGPNEHQANASRDGPHRKIFTRAAV